MPSAGSHIDIIDNRRRFRRAGREAEIAMHAERVGAVEGDVSHLEVAIDEAGKCLHAGVFVPFPIEDEPAKDELARMRIIRNAEFEEDALAGVLAVRYLMVVNRVDAPVWFNRSSLTT
ncbi:hypothetical protein [Halegenticoccus tardaugens]|uniref:hypothetical protein n=1 Tax=Halegenticoccus tardaugens TaxID=2071624 RepID=UPI00100B2C29|nr:hypothetical protein [Halegenticoccus tardaugens]